jgi:hypothetical protein
MSAADEMAPGIRARFWARVEKRPDGCWIWTGVINHNGYGRYTYARPDGRSLASRAHRIAYELLVGPIPDGLQLDHLCRVKACVNPAHLEPVTQDENMRRTRGPQRSPFAPGLAASIERRDRVTRTTWRVVWRVYETEPPRKRYKTFTSPGAAEAFAEQVRNGLVA